MTNHTPPDPTPTAGAAPDARAMVCPDCGEEYAPHPKYAHNCGECLIHRGVLTRLVPKGASRG